MSPQEKLTIALLALAALFIVVATLVLLSRLTADRLHALGGLRSLLATYPTYVIGVIGVGNEIYQAFRYDTAFDWTGILTLLGITAATGAMRSGQKETAATVKGVEQTTDVILNTMPVEMRKGQAVQQAAPAPPPPPAIPLAGPSPFTIP